MLFHYVVVKLDLDKIVDQLLSRNSTQYDARSGEKSSILYAHP
jgi:hypothetical protein